MDKNRQTGKGCAAREERTVGAMNDNAENNGRCGLCRECQALDSFPQCFDKMRRELRLYCRDLEGLELGWIAEWKRGDLTRGERWELLEHYYGFVKRAKPRSFA